MKTLRNILCAVTIVAGLGLFGCEQTTCPTITMQREGSELNQKPQYSVKRVDVFADDFAYGGRRGIYEITDEQTNKKYLGVSGIGITQLEMQAHGRIMEVYER